MKIAAYLRVSTDEQNTDLQKDAISAFCRMKGWTDITWFIDIGESGSKVSRPEFDKLQQNIELGQKFEAVVTYKFDRISRSTVQLLELMDDYKNRGINFISIVEAIDTTSPMGKMIFGIFAVLAEFERDQLIMRTKAGMKAAKDRGAKIGRPQKPGQVSRATYYRRKAKAQGAA